MTGFGYYQLQETFKSKNFSCDPPEQVTDGTVTLVGIRSYFVLSSNQKGV